MTYTTTVTSKGTITIAAPLRKALRIKPGQRLVTRLSRDNQIVLDVGTDMLVFQAKRAKITKNIPQHLRGLAGDELRKASASAWVADDD